jgi:hypothetical protein
MGELRRAVALVALVLSALSMVTVSAQARVQAGGWSFLYADMETAAEYEPTNQAGVKGSVTKTGTGRYQVDLTAAGAAGIPMVTAVKGETAVREEGVHCQLASFNSDVRIHVDCYRGAVLTDSRFMLTFLSPPAGGEADGAYGFVYSGATTMRYPDAVEVLPETDQGITTVRFHDDAFVNSGGNVQVSAVGSLPARCAVVRWLEEDQDLEDGPEMVVEVKCQNLSDQPAFRPQWTLVYTHERSVVGGDGGFFGYLQAEKPDHDGEYTPKPERNYAPFDFKHTVTRSVDGRYRVQVHGPVANKSILHVSANGGSDTFCEVTDFNVAPINPQRAGTVDVACFDSAWNLVNSKFTLNYYSP